MDAMIVTLIASTLFLTALVICLEAVGFGRPAVASATIAVVSLAVSVACLQTLPKLTDSSVNTLVEIDRALERTDHILLISRLGFTIAVVATIGFCISGSLRVWRHRARLVALHNAPSSTATAPTNIKMLRPTQWLICVAATLAFVSLVCWELYDFVVTNRGVEYYRDHTRTLLYPIASAVVVGIVLALFSRYTQRKGSSTHDRDQHSKAT